MPAPPAPAPPLRIIVADDQATVREGLVALLGMLPDIDVVGAAANGEEALRIAADTQPDAILLDLHMPVLDGIDTTRQLTAEHPDIAVVVLTTYDADSILAALQTVDPQLYDAARVDGASEVQTFLRVALPLAKPVVALVFFFSFVADWNNFFLPLFMLNGEKSFPVILGLYDWNLQVTQSQDMTNLVITGSLLSIVPLALFVVSLQRYWRNGVLVGSSR